MGSETGELKTKPASSGLPSTVLIVMDDRAKCTCLRTLLDEHGFRVATTHSREGAYDAIYTDPPQVVLLDWAMLGSERPSLLAELKADNIYGHLPVILMAPEEVLRAGVDWALSPADDYVITQRATPSTIGDSRALLAEVDLVSRIRLCLARAHRDINANPLTGLPGNITIMREAERRIADGIAFAMGYLDVDNFKPFNDAYGFSRGDEVLRMTARILVNAVRAIDNPDTHVGHIGGDDFVFLIPPQYTVRTCKRIIQDFDCIVPNFYDEEDRQVGAIKSVDRKGNVQTFPLMTVSVAVVDTSTFDIAHLADLSARAAEVKHFTKQLTGSNYIIDRRK